MMSLLPGAMTKQILSTPPAIMRSMRCSLTARGRSMPASSRLPTGSNSLEKARGWMRLPAPAAGTIPHISSVGAQSGEWLAARRFEELLHLDGAMRGGMFGEHALARGGADFRELRIGKLERV